MLTQVCLVAPAALASSILGRLARSGLGVPVFPAETPTALPPAPTPDSRLVLVNPQGLAEYLAWKSQADAQGWHLLDIAGNLQNPLGQIYGWMLAVGAKHSDLAIAEPIIAALSPALPNAWLHAGGPGAGAFLQTASGACLMQSGEVWLWLQRALQQPGSTPFDLQSWQYLVHGGFEKLQREARDYLALDTEPFTPWHAAQSGLLLQGSSNALARELAQWLLILPVVPSQSAATAS